MIPDDETVAVLARLGAAVVRTDRDELARLATAHAPDRAWREVILMASLFAGFPRTITAFDTLRSAGAPPGLGVPDADEATPGSEDVDAGRELFDAIYGDGADRVRAALRDHHPCLASWIESHAYGRVLVRGGLDAATRELVAVAMLAVSGLDRQLASHARGAVRLGARPEQVVRVLEAVEDLVDHAFRERARAVVHEFARD